MRVAGALPAEMDPLAPPHQARAAKLALQSDPLPSDDAAPRLRYSSLLGARGRKTLLERIIEERVGQGFVGMISVAACPPKDAVVPNCIVCL